MRRVALFIFFTLLGYWGYKYPYQWWLKYGALTEVGAKDESDPLSNDNKNPSIPKTFWGSSLKPQTEVKSSQPSAIQSVSLPGVDLAGPVLDELKICFGDGLLNNVQTQSGDLGNLVIGLQNSLGPALEDLLLERKVVLNIPGGSPRTLVYEWISSEEGSDVYWHETDEEGFPKPLDLPEGSGTDLATFDRLKQQGTPSKSSETRLIQLQNGLQLGVEKTDDQVQSLSVKDEGHLAKCRKDAVKTFVCDCLN